MLRNLSILIRQCTKKGKDQDPKSGNVHFLSLNKRQKLFPAKNNPKFCQKHFWHDCQSEKQIFDQKIAEPNFLILLEKHEGFDRSKIEGKTCKLKTLF